MLCRISNLQRNPRLKTGGGSGGHNFSEDNLFTYLATFAELAINFALLLKEII